MLVTEKDWIIDQYYKNDVVDLLETTRSCEGDINSDPLLFAELDYTTYKKNSKVPECGKCYWCLERNWATEKVKQKYEL